MEKYTIIYAEYFQRGSHQHNITKKKYIECLTENLTGTVEELIGWDNVWFILDGHCNRTKI